MVVPAAIQSGTASRSSIVHASQDGSLTNSKGHTELEISRLQSSVKEFNTFNQYTTGDLVLESGITYRNTVANNTGVPFDSNQWEIINSSLPVIDTTPIVKGDGDSGKLLRFEVDGFANPITRVLTPPDADGTIALLEVANQFTPNQAIVLDSGISVGLDISNNDGGFAFANNTTLVNEFTALMDVTTAGNNTGFTTRVTTPSGNDSTTSPLAILNLEQAAGGTINNRTLWEIQNNTTPVVSVAAGGTWDFKGNAITNAVIQSTLTDGSIFVGNQSNVSGDFPAQLQVKEDCIVATTEDISLSGLQIVDTVLLVENDRVLVKDQTAAQINGIFTASSGPWPRATDANQSSEVNNGMFTKITGGFENINTAFVLTTPDDITLSSTRLTFAKFSFGDMANLHTPQTFTEPNIFQQGMTINQCVIQQADLGGLTWFAVVFSDTGLGPALDGGLARGTQGARTDVQNGDRLYKINVRGNEGGSFFDTANITWNVDGNWTGTNQASTFTIATTPSGTTDNVLANIVIKNKVVSFEDNDITNINSIKLNDSNDTHEFTILGGDLTTNQSVTIPATTIDDNFVLEKLAQTLESKTISALDNTITNIGEPEVIADIITGQILKGAPIGADELLLKDSVSGNLRKITISTLPAGGGSGITSLNGDTNFAQVIAAGTGLGLLDAGAVHTLSIDSTVVTKLDPQTLENKIISANNNTISDIGASEVIADIITGQPALGVAAATGDTILIFDTSTATLKKINISLLNNVLPVPDSQAIVFNQNDIFGRLFFDLSAYTTTRVITFPNSSGTITLTGLGQTLTQKDLGTGTSFSVSPSINDGIKFNFNPTTTLAGLNVGAEVSDPSSPVNGDIYYDSATNKFRARENSSWVDMIGGGGVTLPVVDTTPIVFSDTDATSELRFDAGVIPTSTLVVLASPPSGGTIAIDAIDNQFSAQQSITFDDNSIDFGLDIKNTDGGFQFGNNTSTSSEFLAAMTVRTTGDTTGFHTIVTTPPGNDMDTSPLASLRLEQSDGTDIVNRTLWQVQNNNTVVALIASGGNWEFKGNSLTGVGIVRFNADNDHQIKDTASQLIMDVPTGDDIAFSESATELFKINEVEGFVASRRIQGLQGPDVTSATNITLLDGNFFVVQGTTTIDSMSTANWQAGSIVTLLFNNSLTLRNDIVPPGGFARFFLPGATTLSVNQNDMLTLVFDGGEWLAVAFSDNS